MTKLLTLIERTILWVKETENLKKEKYLIILTGQEDLVKLKRDLP
ncbi:hypothetical protein MAR621_02822 [Maribacter dokdonensis]|nr:hypothetical protein MAR621_02822 [Maribacter dokdonensis]